MYPAYRLVKVQRVAPSVLTYVPRTWLTGKSCFRAFNDFDQLVDTAISINSSTPRTDLQQYSESLLTVNGLGHEK